MELTEVKVIFDAENIEKCKNEIINAFYEFGVNGVKIDEPMDRNSLDYYKNEKDFVVNELAVTAYFPKNTYSARREIIINAVIITRKIITNLGFYSTGSFIE